ncbi:hypothetical protein HG531_009329 [Fusarium graminearum]|nr:hypothetical protein HG531_009329 [Fusarium graminearum]
MIFRNIRVAWIRSFTIKVDFCRGRFRSFRVDTFLGCLERIAQLHNGTLNHKTERFIVMRLGSLLDPFLDAIVEIENGLDGLPEIIRVEGTFSCCASLLGFFCFFEQHTDAFELLPPEPLVDVFRIVGVSFRVVDVLDVCVASEPLARDVKFVGRKPKFHEPQNADNGSQHGLGHGLEASGVDDLRKVP